MYNCGMIMQNSAINLKNTSKIKTIVSNGFRKAVYGICKNNPIDLQHLLAVKFYTDSSKLCDMLTTTLRSTDVKRISQIANWAKLLTESVQCYGTALKRGKKHKYYRGISKRFQFEMIAMRFNLPTSTTTDQ
eukprot:481924_1